MMADGSKGRHVCGWSESTCFACGLFVCWSAQHGVSLFCNSVDIFTTPSRRLTNPYFDSLVPDRPFDPFSFLDPFPATAKSTMPSS